MPPRRLGKYLFFAAAAVIASAFWLAYIGIAPRMSWPITTAEVTRSAVKYTRDTEGRRVFEPEIDLAYRVNGIAYVTQTIGSNTLQDYPDAKRLVDASPVGKQDQIHYNPENPYEISGAGYSLGLFEESLVVAAIGLAFGGIGWALFFFSRPKLVGAPEAALSAKEANSKASQGAARKNVFLNLLPGSFALIGLGLLGADVAWVHHRYTINTTWPAVDAEVTDSTVVKYRQSKGGRGYKLETEFRYRVNGKQFITPASTEIGETYSLLIVEVSKPESGKAKAYQRGTHHLIRYNPQDPNDVRFDLAYDFDFLFPVTLFAVLGLGFTYLGVYFTLAISKSGSIRCPSCGLVCRKGNRVCAECGASLPVKKPDQRAAKGRRHESI